MSDSSFDTTCTRSIYGKTDSSIHRMVDSYTDGTCTRFIHGTTADSFKYKYCHYFEPGGSIV
jgi:hypothetical protein